MTVTTAALSVPATSTLLDTWESALNLAPAYRVLHVLDVMCGQADGELADRSLGQLNRILLQARALLFGDTCDTTTDCPSCGEELEASIPLAALVADHCGDVDDSELTVGGLQVRFRAPTFRDLDALTDHPIDDAAEELLARCVTAVSARGREVAFDEVSVEDRQAIDDAIAGCDPDAVIEVQLCCPDCGEKTLLPMDPASFLWDEVQRWALATLSEVAQLATAYGWSQESVLAMTPWRRQAYLTMADVGWRRQ